MAASHTQKAKDNHREDRRSQISHRGSCRNQLKDKNPREEAEITDFTDSTDEEKRGIGVEARRGNAWSGWFFSSPCHPLLSFWRFICEICGICDRLLLAFPPVFG